MLDAPAWQTESRVYGYLRNLLGEYARCGKDVFMRKVEHRCHGPSYQPTLWRCHAQGHEGCAMESARQDLRRKARSFAAAYGNGPLAVLEFHAPGLGPRAMRAVIEKFNRRRLLGDLLGRTVGFLAPTSTGAVYKVLVRRAFLKLAVLAMQLWRKAIRGGFVRFRRVGGSASAIDIACELRVEAEQAVFFLVADGSLSPEQGRAWIADVLDERSPRAKVRRVVYGPGFCKAGEASDPVAFFGSTVENVGAPDPNVTQSWEPCQVCADPECGQRNATTRGERIVTHQAVERKTRQGKLLPVYGREENLIAYVPVSDADYLIRRGLRPLYSPGGRVVGLQRRPDQKPLQPYQHALAFDG